MVDKNDELARLRDIERKKKSDCQIESQEQQQITASQRVKNTKSKKQIYDLKKFQTGKNAEENESLRILGEEIIKSGITAERTKKREKVIQDLFDERQR